MNQRESQELFHYNFLMNSIQCGEAVKPVHDGDDDMLPDMINITTQKPSVNQSQNISFNLNKGNLINQL